MNYHEKQVRSMSSSLPNRSILDDQTESFSNNKNFTMFTGNIKNPPKISTVDDGSGTASNPKNIINNRRRSESFAIYSGQEYFGQSSHNSPNTLSPFLNSYKEENSEGYFSPDALQHHMYPHTMNVDKKIVLYKTEMCRTFEETGNCKYGTKCQFAHDPIEIRNIPRHPRYKTEICKTFWQLGNCPYGKRCCFIHTENELRNGDSKKTSISSTSQSQQQQQQQQSQSSELKDLYGSLDLTIAEDNSILGEIQSQNSSRSASPSKAAEDLKKSISNLGNNSIFNNLSISNLAQLTASKSITERRRKSIIDDKIEELALLVGSNCSISATTAPSSEDPEFKAIYSNPFELWTCESPNSSDSNLDDSKITSQNENKFAMFDKSPGARNSNGIWSKGSSHGTFIPGSQFYKSDDKDSSKLTAESYIFNNSATSSGTSSTKSHGSNHQQLLIDMLNLLDN